MRASFTKSSASFCVNTPVGKNLRVQFRAKLWIGFIRLEGRAFAILGESFEDRVGVVGEVHDHDILLAFVAAVQARNGLHGIAVHDGLVEEHSGKQWLVEAGLEFVRDDHEPVVVTLEAILDQLAFLQLVDRVLADRRVGFRMHEIREGVEHLVVGAALFELLLDDVEIAQPGHAGGGHDHRLGAPADERLHVLLEDAEHHLGLVLDQAVVLKRHVLAAPWPLRLSDRASPRPASARWGNAGCRASCRR